MPCQATSSSPERITWLKDGVPIAETAAGGDRITVAGPDNTLKIEGETPRNGGKNPKCHEI